MESHFKKHEKGYFERFRPASTPAAPPPPTFPTPSISPTTFIRFFVLLCVINKCTCKLCFLFCDETRTLPTCPDLCFAFS